MKLPLAVVVRTHAVILAAITLAPSALAQPTNPPRRPNIIFILADDLGWHDIGYHNSEILTPNLDQLSHMGVRLEHHYVYPICSPTRAALMTGRYPIRYGFQEGNLHAWSPFGLPNTERTIADELESAGYETAICGKWHLGYVHCQYLPQNRGFQHQYGIYLGATDYYKHTHGAGDGLDWHRDGAPVREYGYATTLLSEECQRLILEHDTGTPLFIYAAFTAPHGPFQAPEEYLALYPNLEGDRKVLAAMITCLDDAVGGIVDALLARGMFDNTLLIFSSDNGGSLENRADNSPLRGGKGELYEGGIRVPAFVVWPDVLPGNSVVDEPIHITDWRPTLAALAGADEGSVPTPDGMNVWATIAEGAPSPHSEILLRSNSRWSVLRQGDWKLVLPHHGEDPNAELYDLSIDPSESTNLASRFPDKVAELLGRLDWYAAQAVPPLLSGAEPSDFNAPDVWEPTETDGDVNGDMTVDLTDLTILLHNFGQSPASRIQGDLNGTRDVDLTDLTIIVTNYGVSCP